MVQFAVIYRRELFNIRPPRTDRSLLLLQNAERISWWKRGQLVQSTAAKVDADECSTRRRRGTRRTRRRMTRTWKAGAVPSSKGGRWWMSNSFIVRLLASLSRGQWRCNSISERAFFVKLFNANNFPCMLSMDSCFPQGSCQQKSNQIPLGVPQRQFWNHFYKPNIP